MVSFAELHPLLINAAYPRRKRVKCAAMCWAPVEVLIIGGNPVRSNSCLVQGTAALHTPAASTSSTAALNSVLEHAVEQSSLPPVQMQSPHPSQARPKWPAQTRPHKFASLNKLSQQ